MIDFGITELNSRMEDARKQMETYEEDPSKRDDDWKKTLDTLIQINNHITKEAIFSENETFAEIKPEDMKYLLIPFFLLVFPCGDTNTTKLIQPLLNIYKYF